jgi:AcrR family transcriptional regulator
VETTGSKTRREVRSSIRMSLILEKAGSLFWQKGYNSTSMKDIASVCDCKPANIYNFFESKEDILYEVIKDNMTRMLSLLEPLEDDDTTSPVELLKAFISNHHEFLANMKRSFIVITDTGLNDLSSAHRKEIVELRGKYDRILQKILRRGIESGVFTDIDSQIVSYFISSIIIRSNIWFSEKGRLTSDQIGNMMFDFVYRGIKA